jgi:hypothetical protein
MICRALYSKLILYAVSQLLLQLVLKFIFNCLPSTVHRSSAEDKAVPSNFYASDDDRVGRNMYLVQGGILNLDIVAWRTVNN